MEDRENNNRKTKRTEWIHIRLTPDKLVKINERYRKTPYRDLSTYLRKMLFGKAITVNSRNQSFD